MPLWPGGGAGDAFGGGVLAALAGIVAVVAVVVVETDATQLALVAAVTGAAQLARAVRLHVDHDGDGGRSTRTAWVTNLDG